MALHGCQWLLMKPCYSYHEKEFRHSSQSHSTGELQVVDKTRGTNPAITHLLTKDPDTMVLYFESSV